MMAGASGAVAVSGAGLARAVSLLAAISTMAAAAGTGTGTAAAKRRNVLYIVFDDLRPELTMYGAPWMQTPALQKLADEGLVFERAYCQQSVCAPSRMSFTTGRRPDTTKAWNFLNHFRQAECGQVVNREAFTGVPLAGTRRPDGVSFNASDGNVGMTGSSGQCCTDCTAMASAGCVGWSMVGATCTLFSSVTGSDPGACQLASLHPSGAPCISGKAGEMPTWTPLPQNVLKNGFLAMGVGKYFHDVNKGLGVPNDPRFPAGTGLPPLADPVSWSNVSAQNRNYSAMQEEYGSFNQILKGCAYTGGATASLRDYTGGFGYVDAMDGCTGGVQYCSAEAIPASGKVPVGGNSTPFCDYIAYTDAAKKLEFAAASEQPFFLAVGIRRPHLSFRVPEPYAEMYPVEEVALPVQRTLDISIDPIAWTEFGNLGGLDPYNVTNSDAETKAARAGYYSAVSWADYCAGQVLDALERYGLKENTAVVVHSDHGEPSIHCLSLCWTCCSSALPCGGTALTEDRSLPSGWHLGEYNMWEKRTLWENAAHVPLIMRVPVSGRAPARSMVLLYMYM
eukprot:SAG22_NODE_464_length_10191_cov_14.495541_7_plen_565_part_00